MTSWQEERRNAILEQRRKEHERYAAERLAKVNAICKLAWLNGMSYGRYIAERSKIMEEENKVTVEETPKKRGIREPLAPEKVERVKEMLAEGKKKSEIITETLVSRSTIDRIENGTYGLKQPPKPKADKPAPKAEPKPRPDILRRLIGQAVETLRDAQGNDPDDCALIGKALGLLTAAEMILGDNTKI